MPEGLFGRTNRAFPPVWLRLSVPHFHEDLDALVAAAVESGGPIDVTSQPALWGGRMRGTEAVLTCVSNAHYEHATDDRHASDLIQAHMIETLSCVGRDYFDIYFLRIRRVVEEFQIAGALEAMEMARQEGHVRFLGICCDGPSLATLGTWQFHDAFDALLVPRNHYDPEPYETLSPLARERRVGVVTSHPFDWGYGLAFTEAFPEAKTEDLTAKVIADLAQETPVLVGVRSADEVHAALNAPSVSHEDLPARLAPYLAAWDREETWTRLAAATEATLRRAAEKRRLENG